MGEEEAGRAKQNLFCFCLVCSFFFLCSAVLGRRSGCPTRIDQVDLGQDMVMFKKPAAAAMALRAVCSGISSTRLITHTYILHTLCGTTLHLQSCSLSLFVIFYLYPAIFYRFSPKFPTPSSSPPPQKPRVPCRQSGAPLSPSPLPPKGKEQKLKEGQRNMKQSVRSAPGPPTPPSPPPSLTRARTPLLPPFSPPPPSLGSPKTCCLVAEPCPIVFVREGVPWLSGGPLRSSPRH